MNVEFNMLRSIKTEYNGGYPTDSVDTGHSFHFLCLHLLITGWMLSN